MIEGTGTRTAERVAPGELTTRDQYLVYLRHLFAYEFAAATIPPGSQALEIGCGEGYGTALLAKTAHIVIGLDIDQATVEQATAKYASETLSFRLYDGTRIPFPDNSLDAAVSFQVIEHVRDDSGHVREISRVLKPGGLLVMTTPNRTYRLRPGQKPWNRFHVREYCADDLQSLLEPWFEEVAVRGIRGSDEVQAIEKARVAWALRPGPIATLRRSVPEPLKAVIGDVMRLARRIRPGSSAPASFTDRYHTSDFRVTDDVTREALDLLAVCAK
jgi:SAM-dependent methyltransferase